jgi:DNA-binding protein YbaB
LYSTEFHAEDIFEMKASQDEMKAAQNQLQANEAEMKANQDQIKVTFRNKYQSRREFQIISVN